MPSRNVQSSNVFMLLSECWLLPVILYFQRSAVDCMRCLFHAADMDSLYISYQYAQYLQKKFECRTELIWQPVITENVQVSQLDIFNKIYHQSRLGVFDRLYGHQEIINQLNNHVPKIDVNRVITYLGLKKINRLEMDRDISSFDIVFTFKDTSMRDKELLSRVGRDATVVKIEQGIGMYAKPQATSNPLDFLVCNWPSYIIHCNHPAVQNIRRENILRISKSLYNRKRVRDFLLKIDAITSEQEAMNAKDSIDILYIGQHFQGEKAHFSEILNQIPKDAVVAVKPHPQETNLSEYRGIMEKCDVRGGITRFRGLPAEAAYALLDSPLVITPYSSAGAKIMRFHNANTIYTFELLNKGVSPELRYFITNSGEELPAIPNTKEGLHRKIRQQIYNQPDDQTNDCRKISELDEVVKFTH